MEIILYKNISPSNYVNKNLSLVATLEGIIRSPTSIIDPTIVIERENPTGFNYVHIPSFNRYYYVKGISTEINGVIGVTCHVDVLMTYKNDIRNATAIIKRQENQFNLLLDDGIFKAYQNTKHKLVAFPNSFNGFSYILALAGNSEEA